MDIQRNGFISTQIAVPDITEAVAGADIFVFVVPHQFIGKLCDQMKPHVKPGAIGISLIKVRTDQNLQNFTH